MSSAKEHTQFNEAELVYSLNKESDRLVIESVKRGIGEEILSVLKRNGYNFGVTYPCSKLKNIFTLLEEEPSIKITPVTKEEEGVGVCTGAFLAGKKPFMLIQSSGLGNSFNVMASLLKTYRIPLLIMASYRGYYDEKIPAQVPLGAALPGMLDAMSIPHIILTNDIQGLEEFCDYAHAKNEPHVALLSPELFIDA